MPKQSVFLVLNSVNFDFIVNKLVDVGDDGAALDVHEDEAGDDLRFNCGVSSGRGAGVHIKLVLVLLRFKLVCMSGNENITVQLPINHIVHLYY